MHSGSARPVGEMGRNFKTYLEMSRFILNAILKLTVECSSLQDLSQKENYRRNNKNYLQLSIFSSSHYLPRMSTSQYDIFEQSNSIGLGFL